jgi:hypothetical protein
VEKSHAQSLDAAFRAFNGHAKANLTLRHTDDQLRHAIQMNQVEQVI